MITLISSTTYEVPGKPNTILALVYDDTQKLTPYLVNVQRVDRPQPHITHRHLTRADAQADYDSLQRFWAVIAKGGDQLAGLRAMAELPGAALA